MFHFFSVLGSVLDNESAFITGAGNGFAELPATRGWFFFTPSVTPVSEPTSLALLGAGFLLLGAIANRRQRPYH
jgi:PEP-CTERM motif